MRIIIVGAGDVGFQLGRRLSRDHHDITVIDANPDKVRRAADQLDGLAVEGQGDSYRVLLQAGIRETDVLAAVTDNDDANLMACRLAKASGVEVTIARVRNGEFTEPDFPLTTEQLGVDHIIHPEREAANAILRLLQESSATHVLDLEKGKIEVIGLILEANSPLIGPSLAELGARYGHPPVQVVAVERNHETIVPKGSDRLYAGDLLFAVCAPEYAKEFFGLAGKRKKQRIGKVMLMGGGMVARFIAEAMAGTTHVKIIEHDYLRAQRLAENLPGALVIHGDGTDHRCERHEPEPHQGEDGRTAQAIVGREVRHAVRASGTHPVFCTPAAMPLTVAARARNRASSGRPAARQSRSSSTCSRLIGST